MKEIISNNFNVNINKEVVTPPLVKKEIISNSFIVDINKQLIIQNNPPSIANIKVLNVDVLGNFELQFDLIDKDNDRLDVFLKIGLNDYETILTNQESGTIKYKGTNMPSGTNICRLKVTDEKSTAFSEEFEIIIPQMVTDDIFESIELITDKNIKGGEYARVAIRLKSKATINNIKLNPKLLLPQGSVIKNAQWEKGTVMTDYRQSISEISSKTSELSVNLDGIKGSVEKIKGDYVTQSEMNLTSEKLEFKISQSGGSNLLYNSNFANKHYDKWFFTNGGRQFTDFNPYYYDTDGCMILQCVDGTYFYFGQDVRGLKGNTKYTFSVKLKKELNTMGARLYIDFFDVNGNWIADSGVIGDFEINGYREYITFTTPPNAVRGNVFVAHRGTHSGGSEYSLLWLYQPCLTEGEIHAGWTPHSNEVYDGITKIDKDGITVKNTSANTYTQIDTGSFSVNNNNGATIAEFSQNSNIPILTAGDITANTVKANNLATSSGNKSWSGRTYYVQGATGVDAEGRGDSWGNAFRSVQYVLDNYIEDILNDNVSIHIGASVQGWNCYGRSGRGTLQFYLENDAVVSTEVIIQGCTNFVRVVGTNDRKGTLKKGIVAHNCSFVDIGWVTFRGENWWHGSGSCNVLFSDFTRGIVRMCDLNGVTYGVIADLGSHVWLFNNRGSVTNYVGIGAYTRVSTARSGSDICPDYTGYMYGSSGHSNLYIIEDGATFTKTPSVGWSPSYTPTQRTSTWNFNKIWSDETLHGWSNRNELIQGYSSAYDTGRWTGYLQMTDGMSAIKNTISGGTNLSGRIYVQRRTSSGAGTGTCCMYASDGTHIANISMARGAGAWFTLNSSVVSKIMNGSITYFYLKNDSNNINTYMKMETLGKIELTYTK